MMDFCRIELDDIAQINYNESKNADFLKTLFLSHRYVYVRNESHRLLGIITPTSFQNHFSVGKYVNYSFRYAIDCELGGGCIEAAAEIIKETRCQEVPVLSEYGELLYVLRKSKNLINSFDFDWNLCDIRFTLEYLEGFNNVLYFRENQSIVGLKNHISGFIKVKKMDKIEDVQKNDLLIHEGYMHLDNFANCTIGEIYLSAIARTALKCLMSNGIDYFFFQTPVSNKLKDENKIFCRNPTLLSEEELLLIYQEDRADVAYWTSGDFHNVDFRKTDEGRYLPANVNSKTYNVFNNERMTFYQPDSYDHTIFVIGTCIARGFGVSDRMTIPSILQEKLIKNSYKYIVRNLGTGGGLNIYSDIRDFVNILKSDLKAGDVVLHLGYNCWEKSKAEFENYFELSELFNRKHSQRCFLNDAPHLTPYSNRVVTDYIFENIKDKLGVS